MRLEPIEQPPTLLGRIAYAVSQRRLGKVVTPMKVVNARVPKSFKLAWEMAKLDEGLSLDPELALLCKTHTAQLNDCAFCIDIAKAISLERGYTLDKCRALSGYRESPLFSDEERAALAYVEEATLHKRVSDATFEELRRHFDERQIVELTLLNAIENYYNLVNLPLGIESDGLCSLALDRQRLTQTPRTA